MGGAARWLVWCGIIGLWVIVLHVMVIGGWVMTWCGVRWVDIMVMKVWGDAYWEREGKKDILGI